MKKILLSIMTIALVSAVAVGATRAFFSDTETSVDNTFIAGEIDLQIDNTSYYNLVQQALSYDGDPLTWTLSDLTNQVFFDFDDVKPGDLAEDTVSVHVDDNDSWVCANVALTGDADNGINEPESAAGDATDGPAAGELDQEVAYIFWGDDGDNVLEDDETVFEDGALTDFSGAGLTYVIADSATNNLYGGVDGDPVPGATTVYLGKGWCYGSLTPAPVAAGINDPTVNPGFTCDGALVSNVSQTDSAVADVTFYAVQSRNNASFLCSSWTP